MKDIFAVVFAVLVCAAGVGAFLAVKAATASLNPVMQAQSYELRVRADSQALADAQRRAQQQAQWEIDQAARQATLDQWAASLGQFIQWVVWMGTVAVCILVAAFGLGGGIALVGGGNAVRVAAELRANLVRVDVNTGQFPALRYVGKGFVSVTDPNTGATMLVDTRQEGSRQMIAAAGAVRLAGVVSHNAMLAGKHAGGVAQVGVNPVVVLDGGDGDCRVPKLTGQVMPELGDGASDGEDCRGAEGTRLAMTVNTEVVNDND